MQYRKLNRGLLYAKHAPFDEHLSTLKTTSGATPRNAEGLLLFAYRVIPGSA